MINYAEKYAGAVDERFKTAAISAGFVNSDYDFEGVQTVKVYSVPTAPLNDYVMSGTSRYGTPDELQNDVQVMTMTQDRSFTFTIDRRSNLDTMGAMAAGTALARQMDEVVIPEVDAYRFAKMALSAGHVEMGAVTGETAYEAFLDANSALTNANVPLTGRCAAVTPDFYKKVKLDKSFIMAGDVAQEMRRTGQIGMVDGVALYLTPKAYLPDGAEFLIAVPCATCAPEKLEDYKIHDNPPGTNGWLVEGRVLHDAFVFDSKKDGIYVHMGRLGSFSFIVENGKLKTEGIDSLLRAGAKLVYKTGQTTLPTLGADVSGWTAAGSGGSVTADSGTKLAVAVSIGGKAALGALGEA